MSKNKKDKKTSTEQGRDKSFVDEQVISRAIVKAYFEIENKKKENEQNISEKEQNEWRYFLRQKDYSDNEKWFIKRWHHFRNDFVGMWRLLFINPKEVKDMRATYELMRFAIKEILVVCKWLIYTLAMFMVYCACTDAINVVFGSLIAIALWAFARIFRIASFEVEKIDDGNLIIAIFSGVLSFVAVVIAIVAIIVDKI